MFCWAAPWRGLAFLGNEPSWALLSNGTNSLKRTQEVIENKLIEKALTAPRPATPPMRPQPPISAGEAARQSDAAIERSGPPPEKCNRTQYGSGWVTVCE